MTATPAYDALAATFTRLHRLGHLQSIAGWDQLHDLFLRGHLGAWIAPFTQAVSGNAGTAFYRELAELTLGFLRMEVARLAPR